jgi:hypothetical protein
VENAVAVVERWILAALRYRKFFSVAELNDAVDELLDRLNNRRFRKREGTRASLFAEIDQPALQPLPVERYVLAETIGMATAEVVRTILENKPHPEMGYRACLGILRLAKTYSHERLEAASQRALQLQACSYTSLRSILKRSLDRQLSLEPEQNKPGPQHENVRGASYYDPPTTLLQ